MSSLVSSHPNPIVSRPHPSDLRHAGSVVSDSLRPHGLQPSNSSVQGILQARILEWVAFPFSRGSSRPRD